MTICDIEIGALQSGDEEITRRAPDVAPLAVLDKQRLNPFPRTTPKGGGIWHVRNDQVHELPELYPLEPTSAFVFVPNEDPSAISERISGELRDRSIEAYYDDVVAKAKCHTADGTDFRIRMYRGRGKFSHGIIVEVQRRFGMSMNFHNDAVAILDRAQGKEVPPHLLKKNSNPQLWDVEDDYQADGVSSLAIVARMMKSSCRDSEYMGLQILVSLTDASKMGPSTARIISEELMRPENEVGAMVLSHITNSRGKGDETRKLRTMSLSIFANAFASVQKKLPKILREQMEPVLVKDLCLAESNQRCAFQAARCVEWLLSRPDTNNYIQFHGALKIAVEVGNRRHAALERQAQKCLDKISKRHGDNSNINHSDWADSGTEMVPRA